MGCGGPGASRGPPYALGRGTRGPTPRPSTLSPSHSPAAYLFFLIKSLGWTSLWSGGGGGDAEQLGRRVSSRTSSRYSEEAERIRRGKGEKKKKKEKREGRKEGRIAGRIDRQEEERNRGTENERGFLLARGSPCYLYFVTISYGLCLSARNQK